MQHLSPLLEPLIRYLYFFHSFIPSGLSAACFSCSPASSRKVVCPNKELLAPDDSNLKLMRYHFYKSTNLESLPYFNAHTFQIKINLCPESVIGAPPLSSI